MCYQTRLLKKREEIAERFQAEISAMRNYSPQQFCSGFDFPLMPVITDTLSSKVQLYHWGLVPEWSQDTDIKRYTLNARIETLHDKKSFKASIQQRCLILADGFYEWQWRTKNGSKKEKYLITKANDALFAFAGIYTQWTGPDQETYPSYTLLTTKANALMTEIHNTKQRMPVILKKEDEQLWLSGADYKQFAYPYSTKLQATSLNQANDRQTQLFN